jgi:hypothetical protein
VTVRKQRAITQMIGFVRFCLSELSFAGGFALAWFKSPTVGQDVHVQLYWWQGDG